jgi:hypothetical protein
MSTGSRNLSADSFLEIWEKLEEAAAVAPESGFLSQRIIPESIFDISLALKRPDNIKTVLFRINKQNIVNPANLLHGKGFSLNQTVLKDDNKDHATLELILEDRNYASIFISLVQDIISSCSVESTERKMVNALVRRLQMWQHFLEFFGSEGLSELQQRGLYGELKFLFDFLIPHIGIVAAVQSWKGPQKAQHDFQMSGIAIEIKSGYEKQPQKIKISSEQQLDDHGFHALYLHYISIKEVIGSGKTLPQIIEEIRLKTVEFPGILNEFNNLLILAGYLDSHKEKYSHKGFVNRSEYTFKVRDGFPRIIESNLKAGVGNVEYSIDLSACFPYIIDNDEFQKILNGIKNGC